ncbi:putative hydroxybutyrate dehydrogenase [Lophiotrema nucula]|uniref:Putative hydroxybutyrate dehydrogenase n=1 Tax=Lophiotrema nucula TaxID=690887 RepID=A0A6A5ZQ82_9PLEO|nr:putative hydroxybutyrate dehydrogenase [Lophiotrema nucula]
MPSHPQKSVLITGCSTGGIGDALAKAFAARNLLVFATARNPQKIDPALSSLPNVKVLTLDTTSPSSIADAVAAVSAKTGGRLDYLVNNAGQGLISPFLDTDLSKARALFEVNFWAVLGAIQAFKTALIAAKGTIINTSSIAGVAPDPYESIYCASKAALTHFSETLRLELKPLGVHVITLTTGMIQSQWHANSVPTMTLPADSYYHPALEQINGSLAGVNNKKIGTPVLEYGEDVVKQVLKDRTGRLLWGGAMSGTVWWCQFLPQWVLDGMLWKKTGLWKVADFQKGK